MPRHQGKKSLKHTFEQVWHLLATYGRQSLKTLNGRTFDAFAAYATKAKGRHKGEKVIRIQKAEKSRQEYARIYPCCWGHTTNCYGTRNGTYIGGYSDALDKWAARTKRGHSPPSGPGGPPPNF